MQYKVIHNYSSGTLGPWKKGDVVEVPDEYIDWLLRDSPGVVEKVKPPRKRKAAPAKNRMVTKAQDRAKVEA